MARTYRYKGKRFTLEQMLANRARRSTLPDTALPANQLARRQRNTRARAANRNPLYNPLAPLSGETMRSSAEQLTRLELDPKIEAIKRQAGAEQAQAGQLAANAGGYYQQIAAEARRGLDRQRAITDTLHGRIREEGLNAQGRLEQAGNRVGAEMQTDAQLRGPGLQQETGRAAEELAAARGLARNATNRELVEGVRQGAAGETLANTAIATGALRGGEVQERLALARLNAGRQAAGEVASLEGQRGEKFTENLLSLRDKGFEQHAVTAGLMGDQAELEFKATEAEKTRQHQVRVQRLANSARAKLEARKQAFTREERAKYDLTAPEKAALEEEKLALKRAANKRGSKRAKAESESSKKLKGTIDTVLAETGTWKGNYSKDRIVEKLTKRENNTVNRVVARAVAELKVDGTLSTGTLAALRRSGVKVPRTWTSRTTGPPTPVR